MTVVVKANFTAQIETLPPLPAIAQRVLVVTQSPDSSAEDMARVLREDPIIAARILRVANSPFYGASRQITQLSRAVLRLGTIAVRNLVLGICANNVLSAKALRLPEHERMWHHAIAVASGCEMIARQLRLRCPEEAFLAGLLHDTGRLAMLLLQPQRFRSTVARVREGAALLDAEREEFGMDHAEAGDRIMNHWGLPESLCTVVGRHHGPWPDNTAETAQLLAIVVLADMFAQVAGYGFEEPCGQWDLAEEAARQLGLSLENQIELFSRLERRAGEATEMLGHGRIRISALPPAQDAAEIVWLTGPARFAPSLSTTLLQQRGYKLRCMAAIGPASELPDECIVVVDLPTRDPRAADLAREVLGRVSRNVVVLGSVDTAGNGRARDGKTGFCLIPRLFTAFDFQWAQEQMHLGQ